MSRYFDRQGNPLTTDEWIGMLANDDNKRVAYDEAADGVDVSTVWLGLNHRFGDGPPLIFETMIFGGDHDQEQWRYSTEAEALAGHARAVELASGGRC